MDKKNLSAARLKNRAKILNAAEPLFERLGYQKTTIQDVCKAAGLSKPTFYGIFKDKAELMATLFFQIAEDDLNEWYNDLPKNSSSLRQILSFIDFYQNTLTQRPIYHSMLYDPFVMEQFASLFFSEAHSPIRMYLKQILIKGIESGEFRQLNPDVMLWMIYALLDTMYILYPVMTGQPGASDNPQMAEEVKNFIIRGLGVDYIEK